MNIPEEYLCIKITFLIPQKAQKLIQSHGEDATKILKHILKKKCFVFFVSNFFCRFFCIYVCMLNTIYMWSNILTLKQQLCQE